MLLSLERLPLLVQPGDAMHGDEADPSGVAGDALQLEVTGPDSVARAVVLDQPVIKVGRSPSAQLVLDNPDVSRMHAVIERTDEGALLLDLGASTGTLLNGRSVSKASLATGDEITIGPFQILVKHCPKS